jgi:hypothetical protein
MHIRALPSVVRRARFLAWPVGTARGHRTARGRVMRGRMRRLLAAVCGGRARQGRSAPRAWRQRARRGPQGAGGWDAAARHAGSGQARRVCGACSAASTGPAVGMSANRGRVAGLTRQWSGRATRQALSHAGVSGRVARRSPLAFGLLSGSPLRPAVSVLESAS